MRNTSMMTMTMRWVPSMAGARGGAKGKIEVEDVGRLARLSVRHLQSPRKKKRQLLLQVDPAQLKARMSRWRA